MSKKIVFIAVLLMGLCFYAGALTFDDIMLSVPPVTKLAFPLLVGGGMIMNNLGGTPIVLLLIAPYVVPNASLLFNVYTNNPGRTELWRTITIFVDGATTLVLAGLCIQALVNTSENDPTVAPIYFVGVLISALATGLDFIPYSFEKKIKGV